MNLKTLAVLIILSLPLAGCGNKGPLVLPTAPVSDAPATDAMPAGETTDAEEVVEPNVDAEADSGVDAGSNDEAGSSPPPR